MTALETQTAPRTDRLPARHAELVIRPLGNAGRYVVKDPARAEYFEIGEEEHFLLTQLDGHASAAEVRSAFEQRFGEPLPQDDLDQFLSMARQQKLVEDTPSGPEKRQNITHGAQPASTVPNK